MKFHLSGVYMVMYTYICAIINMGGLQLHPLTVESTPFQVHMYVYIHVYCTYGMFWS